MAPDDPSPDTKACPLCGETIKAIAVRCKHCQADLSIERPAPSTTADFSRGVAPGSAAAPSSEHDFEQRFLDFAYETHERLTAVSVAHALKLPIAYCDQRLELLAAGDTIRREVDDEGNVYFEVPAAHAAKQGHTPGALVQVGSGEVRLVTRGSMSSGPPPTEAQAVAGLVLNLCIPGAGSLVAGKPGPGIAQLAMVIAGLPLCFLFIGFPIVFAAWLWAVMTGVQAMQEAKGLNRP